jgi:hypothetical protein
VQAASLPRPFFMFDNAPSAGFRSGAWAGSWMTVIACRLDDDQLTRLRAASLAGGIPPTSATPSGLDNDTGSSRRSGTQPAKSFTFVITFHRNRRVEGSR